MAILVRKSDEIMMSLVHFFVTKENYAPILVQGVKDEIWLEKVDGPYRIIRISCNSIINEEQFKFDIFKMKNIMQQIKKKTLSWRINALNICLDVSDKVKFLDTKNIESIKISNLDEVKENSAIKEAFPTISDNLIVPKDTNGLDLILNVTNDINEKTENENKKFAAIFAPKKVIVTKVIIAICILLYLICAFLSKNFIELTANFLASFGGSNIILVKSGEIWRIISSIFLHVGLIHLIINMYSLSIIGSNLESLVGRIKFIIIYLISGLVGSLFSLVFTDIHIVSVGASGAIFGLMGALIYFGYHYRLYLSDVIRNQIIPIVLINLVIGFIISGIDNYAHIGGLVGGYLTMMALGVSDKSKKRDMLNGWIVLILLIAFLAYVVFFLK